MTSPEKLQSQPENQLVELLAEQNAQHSSNSLPKNFSSSSHLNQQSSSSNPATMPAYVPSREICCSVRQNDNEDTPFFPVHPTNPKKRFLNTVPANFLPPERAAREIMKIGHPELERDDPNAEPKLNPEPWDPMSPVFLLGLQTDNLGSKAPTRMACDLYAATVLLASTQKITEANIPLERTNYSGLLNQYRDAFGDVSQAVRSTPLSSSQRFAEAGRVVVSAHRMP